MPEQVQKVPLSKLRESPDNPRKHFGDLSEMAESITAQGLIEPIIARKLSDGALEIVAGHRRARASKLAGLKEVDVIVREMGRQQAIETALVENTERQSLNALEEAQGYAQLMGDFGMTADQVAERVGVKRATVYSYSRLIDAIEPIKAALVSGKLDKVAAVRLAAVNGERLQERAFARYLTMAKDGAKPSVRALERMLRTEFSGKAKKGLTKHQREDREHGADVALRRRALVRLLARVAELVERRAHLDDTDLRTAVLAVAETGGEAVREVFQRRGVRVDRFGKVVGAQLRSLLVEAVVAPWAAIGTDGEYSPAARALAKAYGLSLSELERAVAAEAEAEGLFRKP